MSDSSKKLEIATKTITIKVIQVDGHKMTKATFDQIPIGGYNSKDEMLGWVQDNRLNRNTYYDFIWILYINSLNNKLEKYKCTDNGITTSLDQLYIAT